jgi:hypothetical protein
MPPLAKSEVVERTRHQQPSHPVERTNNPRDRRFSTGGDRRTHQTPRSFVMISNAHQHRKSLNAPDTTNHLTPSNAPTTPRDRRFSTGGDRRPHQTPRSFNMFSNAHQQLSAIQRRTTPLPLLWPTNQTCLYRIPVQIVQRIAKMPLIAHVPVPILTSPNGSAASHQPVDRKRRVPFPTLDDVPQAESRQLRDHHMHMIGHHHPGE